MKARLMTIVNKLISQKNNKLAEKNRADLRNFFKMIEAWAVFKSNRQQSGELLHFAQRFVRKKLKNHGSKLRLNRLTWFIYPD